MRGMSTLGTYLRDHAITFDDFARRIGRSRSTVSRIVAGKVPVDRPTADAIYRATGGVITPNDLYGIPPTAAGDRPAASAAEV